MKKEEISLKNTKAEILDALNAALEREKQLTSTKSNPVQEEKTKKVNKAIESSRVNVEQNIFSEELNKKFKDLELAIASEEEKLQELYGVEKQMMNLTIAVNAAKDCLTNLEEKKKVKTDELNDSIKQLEEKYKLKTEELQNFYDQSIKKRKLEREREEEEYNYKIKREREISNNEWEDIKQKRERELKSKEDEATKLLEEATIKSKNIADLEEKVASIPTLLEKEYERGKKDTTLELEKEYKYKNDLLCKDYQNTIDRQNDKIESLQEELSKVRELNKLLQDKNDKAYLQIKDMATKTVEATGGVKIIANKQSEN